MCNEREGGMPVLLDFKMRHMKHGGRILYQIDRPTRSALERGAGEVLLAVAWTDTSILVMRQLTIDELCVAIREEYKRARVLICEC